MTTTKAKRRVYRAGPVVKFMSRSHTPGPWRTAGYKSLVGIRAGAYGATKRIARVYKSGTEKTIKDAEGEANALLIAASPDLYSGCSEALYVLEEIIKHHFKTKKSEYHVAEGTVARLRLALEKATPTQVVKSGS